MVHPGYIKRIASSIHSYVLCGWDGRGDYTRGHRSQVRTPVHAQLSRCIFLKTGTFGTGLNGCPFGTGYPAGTNGGMRPVLMELFLVVKLVDAAHSFREGEIYNFEIKTLGLTK